jgi:hypothetical protein
LSATDDKRPQPVAITEGDARDDHRWGIGGLTTALRDPVSDIKVLWTRASPTRSA